MVELLGRETPICRFEFLPCSEVQFGLVYNLGWSSIQSLRFFWCFQSMSLSDAETCCAVPLFMCMLCAVVGKHGSGAHWNARGAWFVLHGTEVLRSSVGL